MQPKFVIGWFVFGLAGVAHAAGRILPKACGSDAVEFKVKAQKSAGDLQPPADGKAKIVFIQTYVLKGGSFMSFGTSDFTTRFGIDGNWAGAAGNNSYFSLDVTPGEHHLCASVQGTGDAIKDMVGADLLTVEAGKTYYFQFIAEKIHGNSAGNNYYSSAFREINPDEGAYRATVSGLSSWTEKPKSP